MYTFERGVDKAVTKFLFKMAAFPVGTVPMRPRKASANIQINWMVMAFLTSIDSVFQWHLQSAREQTLKLPLAPCHHSR